MEDITNSKVVCAPLRLLDCSISVDGAAALVLAKDKADVKIIGSALSTDSVANFEHDSLTSWKATQESSRAAFSSAGIGPEDIDVAELHDAFTITELISIEDIGFARPGKAYKKIDDGYFKLDGKLPINPSGGLIGKGHPVSATGIAQVYSLVKQLRNQAETLQVENAKIGLSQNIGGAGGTVSCHIFKKVQKNLGY